MSHSLETTFEFEELSIILFGRISTGNHWFGTATLEGDEDGFFVSHIALAGGTHIRRRGNGTLGLPAQFEDELFKRIAAVIENPKTAIGKAAADAWRWLVSDAHDEASVAAVSQSWGVAYDHSRGA